MSDDFLALLNETGAEFTPPDGFVPCATRANSAFAYQYAHRSPSGDLELRYRIDSIKRLEEERRIANAGVTVLASVNLNSMYQMSFTAAVFNLSGGKTGPTTVFKSEDARALFGADWAALSVFHPADHDFAPGYDTAAVFCFHKHNVADVYLIGVFNDGFSDGSNADRLLKEPPGFRFV